MNEVFIYVRCQNDNLFIFPQIIGGGGGGGGARPPPPPPSLPQFRGP